MSPHHSWNLRIRASLVLVLFTINAESLFLNTTATKSNQDLNEFTINRTLDGTTEKYFSNTSVTDYAHTDNVAQARSKEGNFNSNLTNSSNVNIQSLNTGEVASRFPETPFQAERTIGISKEYSIKFTDKPTSPLKGIETRNSRESAGNLSNNTNSSTTSNSEASSTSYINTEITTPQMKPDLTVSSTNTFSTLSNSLTEPIRESKTYQENEKTTNDIIQRATEPELVRTTNRPRRKQYKTIHREAISFDKSETIWPNERLESTTNVVHTETESTSEYSENSNSVLLTTTRPSTSTSSISSTGGESSEDHKDFQRNDHNSTNQRNAKLEEKHENLVQRPKKSQTQAQLDEATIKNLILTEKLLLDNEANMRYIKDNGNDSKEHISTRDIRFVTKSTYHTPKDSEPSVNTAADARASTDEATYLEVEPLGQENKGKNHTLYRVNSNYKRFKKIEIMPPKSFKRDPNDNSWRNESISSLGIVFKANNSSKPLTLALKNKTDADLIMVPDKDNKTEPELRERLEKLSELRKSKKKRPDDHAPPRNQDIRITLRPNTTGSTEATTSYDLHKNNHSFIENIYNASINVSAKYYNFVDYYDSTDLNEKDLTTWPSWQENDNTADDPPEPPRPLYAPDRRATLQYFPPRTTRKPDADGDEDEGAVEVFTKYAKTIDESPVQTTSVATAPKPSVATYKSRDEANSGRASLRESPEFSVVYRDDDRGRDSYVVKHYEEFENDAPAKKYEQQPQPQPDEEDFIPPQTPHPADALTAHQLAEQHFGPEDDYDYESVQRMMREQMNLYMEKLRAELPVVYNSNVVHQSRAGRVRAASSAYLRRLYEAALHHEPQTAPSPDPAYELHYYLPDQEEEGVRRSQ